MKTLKMSQAFSILALGFMASMIPPSCGGSDKALALTPPVQTGSMHVSSVMASPVNCPANSSVVVRTVTFVPNNPNDIILYILIEGEYTTAASTSFGFYSTDLQDAGGNSLGSMTDDVPNRLPGTSMPFRMYGQPFQQQGNAHFFSEGQFPSAAYKIVLFCSAGSTASISTANVVVKIVTLEGVTIIPVSGNITG